MTMTLKTEIVMVLAECAWWFSFHHLMVPPSSITDLQKDPSMALRMTMMTMRTIMMMRGERMITRECVEELPSSLLCLALWVLAPPTTSLKGPTTRGCWWAGLRDCFPISWNLNLSLSLTCTRAWSHHWGFLRPSDPDLPLYKIARSKKLSAPMSLQPVWSLYSPAKPYPTLT